MHDANGHVDVGPGNQVAGNADLDVISRIRRNQEESREILAASVSRNVRAPAFKAGRVDDNRRTAVALHAAGVNPEGTKAVDQILDRAFSHSRDAVQRVGAVAQAEISGEEPACGT